MLEMIASFALGAAANIADKLAGEKITEALSKFIDDKKAPRLISQIESKLQEKYSEYAFYNDFTSYISERKTIACIVAMFYNIDKIGVVGRMEFSEKNTSAFSERYSRYSTFDLTIVRECFDIIYQEVLNANVMLNPHTSDGKIQTYMASIASDFESQNQEQTGMLKQILAIVSQQNNTVVTPTIREDDIQESSEAIKSFLKQIDEISEQDISDEESIAKYFELSNSALIKLRGEPQSQIDKVICALQCRMAIRYCNLGAVDKAFECLSNIDSQVASESKIYHFVYAIIIVNHSIESKFEEARDNLNKALILDENYHRAILAMQFLNALQKKTSLEVILKEIDSHFESILDKNEDKDLIADYYIHRAFICKEFDDFSNAEAMFNKAKEFGYDDLVTDYNLALLHYSKATRHLPKTERFFGVDVEVAVLSKTVSICKYWLIDSGASISDFIKTRMVALYVSACAILGMKHGLESIDDYLQSPNLDYEAKRTLIFELEGVISDEHMAYLDADDRLYAETVNYYKTENYNGLKSKYAGMPEETLKVLPTPTLFMVLQMCMINRDTDTYHCYRKYVKSCDEVPLIYCLDAYALETEGKVEDAKAIVDQYKETSTDYHLLSNIISFYVRNNFLDDATQLFLSILTKCATNEIFVDDKEDFFGRAITFFTKNKSIIAKQFIEAAKEELSENEKIWRVKAQFYDAIFDLPNLLECLDWLYEKTGDFDIGFNRIICNFQLMRYVEALNEAHSLLSTIQEGNISERTRVIWLISNINLFLDKEEESYEWAKKAHELTKEIPSDPSHAAYLARATRTEHVDEALLESIEYKKIHPIVVDGWMKEVKLPSEDSGETLINKLDEALGRSHTDYLQRERDFVTNYKQNHLPNAIILKRNDSLGHFFIFAMQNKLFVSNGDAAVMGSKAKIICDDIFVDALTLIVLKQYGCFDLLKKIPRIHICYATSNKLQEYYPTFDFVYVKELLSWLSTADNIIWEENGFSFETDLSNIFSNEYLICCHIAARTNVPLLTIEPNFEVLCSAKEDGLFTGLRTVGLVSLCYHFMESFPDEAHQGIYQLLAHCSFVNFNANSIIAQIKRDGNTVKVDSLSRFFFCTTSCNMISFANVYLETVKYLISQNENVALDFIELLLKDADKIWRRSAHYRYCIEQFDDKESEEKVQATVQYLVFLLVKIKEILNEIPERIKTLYEKVSLHVSKKFGKDFIENIKGALLTDE